MNKKAVLAELAANLEEYLQHGFRFHPSFMEDFKKLLYDASGHEKEIFALLIKQFNYVKTLGKQVLFITFVWEKFESEIAYDI